MVYGSAAASPRHRLIPLRRDQFVCHVCWEVGSGVLLHCPTCQLDVHVACCAQGQLVETTHFSHSRHPLLALPAIRNADRRCDGCGATAADGPLLFFSCIPCAFDLCALCARSPRHLRHPSHPHILTLGKSSRRSSCLCNGCGQPAQDQILMYRCNDCDFDLHQVCVRLPLHSSAEIKGHEGHSLSLRGVVAGSSSSRGSCCSACGDEAGGRNSWAYTCTTCTRRPFFIHPRCATLEHRGGSFADDTSSSGAIASSSHHAPNYYYVVDEVHQNPRYRSTLSAGSYASAGRVGRQLQQQQLTSNIHQAPHINSARSLYLEDGRWQHVDGAVPEGYRSGGGSPAAAQIYALGDNNYRNDRIDGLVRDDNVNGVDIVGALCRRLPDVSLLSDRDQDAVDRVLELLGADRS